MSESELAWLSGDETRPHPAAREVSTPAELRTVLADRRPLRGVRIQDLDLHPYEELLLTRTELTGLVVLGGQVSDRLAALSELHQHEVHRANRHRGGGSHLDGQIGHSYLCAPIATPTDRGGVEAFEVQHRQAQLRGAPPRDVRPA